MSSELQDTPKRNWPLILSGAAVALLLVGAVIGCVALYVTNFNLLDWLE